MASAIAMSQATMQTNPLPDTSTMAATLLALMNVLVTIINAHPSLSDTLPIDSPSFLFFYPILSCVSLPGIILCNTIYISLLHFVLMKSI